MCELLEHIGASAYIQGDKLEIDASNLNSWEAPYEYMRKMRASVLVMGPLVAALMCQTVHAGGCAIGSRPIDLHLKGLAAMGAKIVKDRGWITVKAERLHGKGFT